MCNAVHFVGFRGEEVRSAYLVWGRPDFWHLNNDGRLREEVADGDTIVFANGAEDHFVEIAYNDSAFF